MRGRGWRAQSPAALGLGLATPALLLVAALVIIPIGLLFAGAFDADGRRVLADLVTDSVERAALARTLWVSLAVAVVATGLGSILAWAMCVTRSALWRALLWLAVLAPFWMSVVVKNYAFVLLLRSNGPVATILERLGLSETKNGLLYTNSAVVLAMVYAMLPYAVLPMYAALSGIDRTLLQAAEVAGASRARALVDVVAPLAARSALSTATLVFVIGLGFYITPVILGGPGKPFVASLVGTHIFDRYDLGGAQALACALLAVALLAVGASQFAARYLPKGAGA
ncbi:ABC transporter permease [Nocardia panacis]|nr:ABC transporter permease [Nocardia panacis]